MAGPEESKSSWSAVKPHRTLLMTQEARGESQAGLRLEPIKPRDTSKASGVDDRGVMGQTRGEAAAVSAEEKQNDNGYTEHYRSRKGGEGEVDEYGEEFDSFDDDDNHVPSSRENNQGPEYHHNISTKKGSINSSRDDKLDHSQTYGNFSPQLSHSSYGIPLPVSQQPTKSNNNNNNDSVASDDDDDDDDDEDADERSRTLLDSFDNNDERQGVRDRVSSEMHTYEEDERKERLDDEYTQIPKPRMLPTELTFSMADLGATISLFQYRTESWYAATVVDYDRDTDMHQIRFGDGAQSWQRLEGKRLRFVKAGDGKGTRQLRASANQRLHRRASARQRKNKMLRSRTGVVDTIVLGAYLGGSSNGSIGGGGGGTANSRHGGSHKKSGSGGVGRKRKQRRGLGKSASQQMLPTLGGA
jgi:hypothetical protein